MDDKNSESVISNHLIYLHVFTIQIKENTQKNILYEKEIDFKDGPSFNNLDYCPWIL